MFTNIVIISLVLLTGMVASVLTRKLSVPAAIAGSTTGAAIFAGAGYTGIIMLTTFFILGTLATGWRKEQKRTITAGALHQQQRKASQVLANGGAAALLGILAALDDRHADLYQYMMAASLASATADTLSSELGMVYGRRFYNVITWKKEAKGLDGVISMEGTLIGIMGALVIAVIYGVAHGFNRQVWLIVLAGALGNLADSVLGAVWERKQYIGNDAVNFLNTLVAALIAWSLTGFGFSV